ncbi:MAG: putative toxin-antitoxin system toxin component, PIN family [Anaerolineae bacterium]|nr:putative toxin-antitoxin system toxin component, PIN family [Anaerolineae bacterium]
MTRIVIDTNVFIAALMSRRGASFRLLELVGTGRFEVSVSVPLVLEYESSAKRLSGSRIALSEQAIDDIIDYICSVAHHHKVYFLWRPLLKDPKDEMVVELAVNAQCPLILTYNTRDFVGIEPFGIEVITPKTFLERLGVLP